MMRPLSGLLALSLAIALSAGCATWKVETSAVPSSAETLPLKGTKASRVKVYTRSQPSDPYREIGTVRAVGVATSDPDVLIQALRQRAARMGADALVGIRFGSETRSGSYDRGLVCASSDKCAYQEGDSTITSVPTAQATAVIFTTGAAPDPASP